jgi:hypothetical protein
VTIFSRYVSRRRKYPVHLRISLVQNLDKPDYRGSRGLPTSQASLGPSIMCWPLGFKSQLSGSCPVHSRQSLMRVLSLLTSLVIPFFCPWNTGTDLAYPRLPSPFQTYAEVGLTPSSQYKSFKQNCVQ